MTQPRVEVIKCGGEEVYVTDKSARELESQKLRSINMRMQN